MKPRDDYSYLRISSVKKKKLKKLILSLSRQKFYRCIVLVAAVVIFCIAGLIFGAVACFVTGIVCSFVSSFLFDFA